jgi:hypothetical protein
MERDKNIEIKKSDIHFVAGNNIELDINFNYILATEFDCDKGSLSKFIKEAVVGYYELKVLKAQEKSEAQKVKEEILALLEEMKTSNYVPTPVQVEKIERIQTEIKTAEIKPLKSIRRFLDEW